LYWLKSKTKEHKLKRLTYNLILAAAAVILAGPVVLSAAEVSVEEVVYRVLLDKSVGANTKRDNIQVLLTSDTGCSRLVEILNDQNNNETRALICQALSQHNPGGLVTSGRIYPNIFIEPLFNCLYSGDQVLSDRAASALAVCFPEQTVGRLTERAVGCEYEVSQRLASMSALERIAGRDALLNLAELLRDENIEIRDRAIVAICQRLAVDKSSFIVNRFLEIDLPKLRWMSDSDFLLLQSRKLSQNNRQLTIKVESMTQDVVYWQNKYLSSETDRFNSMTAENKLTMLRSRLDASQDKPVRQWAASQLVVWVNTAPAREGDLAGGLIKLLSDYIADSEPFVRSAVAEALGVFGSRPNTVQLIDKLLTQLLAENTPACQMATLNTLGQVQHVQALEQCIGIWQSSNNQDVAAAAIAAASKISVRLEQTDSVRVELLVQSIVANADRTRDLPVLRVALFRAIRRIIENEKWRTITIGHFEPLIVEALTDSQADVRAMAVYGYVAIRGDMAAAELLEMGMLDDNEAAVRFAIISAIDTYRSQEFLERLRNRFAIELSADVKSRLQDVIGKILTGMTISEVYSRLDNFKGEGESARTLRSQATAILVEKVSTLKALGVAVDPKHEIIILEFNFDDYLRKAQYEQAGRTVIDLLNYEILEQSKRRVVCAKLFAVISDEKIDREVRNRLIDITQSSISVSFLKSPDIVGDFEKVFVAAAREQAGDVLTLAAMLRKYIIPAQTSFTSGQAERWGEYKKTVAKELAIMILDDKIEPDQSTMATLKSLDPRFESLPVESDKSAQKNQIDKILGTWN
jgi:HEAT repeat protein